MGKKTRMKWRRLDILEGDQTPEPSPDVLIDASQFHHSHHSHPFLKSLETCEVGVDISQVTGAPLCYNPLQASHQSEDYQVQYLPDPGAQYNTATPMYYYNNPATTTSLPLPAQQQMYPLAPLAPLAQYNLVQQDSVQFVPYYYYYPVPDTNPAPPVSNTPAEISPAVSVHPKFISSSSCDSSIENKQQVVRRRRKKKRSQEKDETDDSGYFNGPDSSTETSSDEDRGQSTDLGVTLQLGDQKEEEEGDDVEKAERGAVTIEFGDVQEILDELSRETTVQSEPELSEERREETAELTVSQEENREEQEQSSLNTEEQEQEQSSLNTEEPQTKLKTKSTKKRTKKKASHNNESKEASLLSDSNLVSELPQMEKLEAWTEVRSSRKSRADRQRPPDTTQTTLNKNYTTPHQEVSVKNKKSSNSLRKDGLKKNETKRPLEDLKELFFQEKDVTIIESTKTEERQPSRKEGKKHRKKNPLKKEGNIKKIEISSKPSTKEEEDALDSNKYLLNPFCDFEEFLRPQVRRLGGSSGGMTLLEPCYTPLLVSDYSPNRSYSDGLAQRHSDLRELSFLFGATEEKLIRIKAVKSSILRSGHAKPVILLRPTPSFGSGNFPPSGKILRKQNQVVKRTEIPGPRVKYLPATRMGILGMKRVVVPPQCLANRFGKI